VGQSGGTLLLFDVLAQDRDRGAADPVEVPRHAGAALAGSRRRSAAVNSPVETSSSASSSRARGPRSPGAPRRTYRALMFSHRLVTAWGFQPIRSAASLALAGAGSPACRQFRYSSNRAARTSRSLSVSGAR
jgi:hypothetical protein